MDLEKIINTIQSERINDSDAALKNIASTEKYLEQSYQGRYLFELIQNVRDANKKANLAGSVFIEFSGDRLTISNTGFPFDEPGVRSITTNGDSPKNSTEFIGFKGIGFKSVSEISECPEVVTEWGTLFFNKDRTKKLLADRLFKDHETPLFFIPHFKNERLSDTELERKIVTKISLPLNRKLDITTIEKAFLEIGVHQILLLGNLEIISLKTVENIYNYTISEKTKSGVFEIKLNSEIYYFKQFRPSSKIHIPDAILETLEDKEKEIYSKDPFIDITLVFDIDKHYNLVKKPSSKLFLFLPTQITSGFNFIIHSYFLVNPERKNLRESKLNTFLLDQIGKYISGEWLTIAKKNHRNTFLEFLSFKRNNESEILNHLYNSVINGLNVYNGIDGPRISEHCGPAISGINGPLSFYNNK